MWVEVRGGHVMTARSLLIRGPHHAEPPEAHLKTVPVGKRTAFEVPEKVVPRRTGIRPLSAAPTGRLALAPVGSTPAEHVCLLDTHFPVRK